MARRNAPTHLAASTRAWWRSVMVDYQLEGHHQHLLTLGCEALDRAEEARKRLAEDGSFYTDRHGAPKVHPAVAVERDARLSYARLLRELDLDGEPGPDPRPPRR